MPKRVRREKCRDPRHKGTNSIEEGSWYPGRKWLWLIPRLRNRINEKQERALVHTEAQEPRVKRRSQPSYGDTGKGYRQDPS